MSGRRDRAAALAVLDASALLVVVQKERGGREVEALLSRSAVSTVNLCEVLGKADPDADRTELVKRWRAVGVVPVPFDVADAVRASELYALTAAAGLSLGDRACLALGWRLGLPVWTADAAWARLALPVEVRLVRSATRPAASRPRR
ncbi:MAG: type II toxin-antitoxin system VapC family toxin [Myxococcota bacterium]|nr:type II toxin-antitoxin system VapC family toxin [Myxococcota bacterium]